MALSTSSASRRRWLRRQRAKLRRIPDALYDRAWDLLVGVRTCGEVKTQPEQDGRPDCHDYSATSVRAFRRLMAEIDIDFERASFIDFGSGKGRVLLLAAQYPFRRVTGVEISEPLVRIAQSNVARWKPRLACPRIDIVLGDAATFPIPAEASIFYFYNPFRGAVLERTVTNVISTVQRHPRTAWLIFNHDGYLRTQEYLLAQLECISRPNLDVPCGVYRVRPARDRNSGSE